MKNTPRTLGEMAKEVSSRGYVDRARQRAARRKSPWNLVLLPLGLGGIAGTLYVLVQVMWRVHTLFYPAHVGRLREFWGSGIRAGAFAAHRAFAREAEGVEGASFRRAMGELGKIALLLVPICLVLSVIGAATLSNLR